MLSLRWICFFLLFVYCYNLLDQKNDKLLEFEFPNKKSLAWRFKLIEGGKEWQEVCSGWKVSFNDLNSKLDFQRYLVRPLAQVWFTFLIFILLVVRYSKTSRSDLLRDIYPLWYSHRAFAYNGNRLFSEKEKPLCIRKLRSVDFPQEFRVFVSICC